MQCKIFTLGAIKNKVVALRVDFNVPVKEGKVTENTRIVESLPTIQKLLEYGAKQVHILSHMGRPKGEPNPDLSLAPVAKELETLLGEPVEFRADMTTGNTRVQMHENVRFYPGEKKNDPAFVQQMLDGMEPDVFVLDGFAVAHRAHASVVGLADHMPAFAGYLIEKEIEHLFPFLSKKRIPGLTVMIGGVKMETKVPVLEHFAQTAENILIGGALATTFLKAAGHEVGQSLYEEEELETAQKVMEKIVESETGFHRPVDVICADSVDSPNTVDVPLEDVCGSMQIFDIGPHTVASYTEILRHSKIIIWNGPMGLLEKDHFARGTIAMLKVVAELTEKDVQTILGGGDTLKAMKKAHIDKERFTHVSTGGGAMLEFLEGKELPGIKIVVE